MESELFLFVCGGKSNIIEKEIGDFLVIEGEE